jgi:hypothetical protein
MERFDYQAAAERLVQTANARGGADNITAILLVAGQPQVPSAGGASAPEPRRETVPELPALAPVAVVDSPASQPVSAPPSAPVATTPESTGRRVPWVWVLAAAALGLAVGVGVGWSLASARGQDPAALMQAASASVALAQPCSTPTAPTVAQPAVPPVQPAVAQGTVPPAATDAGVP